MGNQPSLTRRGLILMHFLRSLKVQQLTTAPPSFSYHQLIATWTKTLISLVATSTKTLISLSYERLHHHFHLRG